jgi:hypothetical protein
VTEGATGPIKPPFSELTTTLVELDKLKRRRRDQQALVHEVDRVQRSLRWALLKLGPPVSLGLAP